MAVNIQALKQQLAAASENASNLMSYSEVCEFLATQDNVIATTATVTDIKYNDDVVPDNYLVTLDTPVARVMRDTTVPVALGQKPVYKVVTSKQVYIHRLAFNHVLESLGMTKMAALAAIGAEEFVYFMLDVANDGANKIKIDLLQRIMDAGVEQTNYLQGNKFTPAQDSVEYYVAKLHIDDALGDAIAAKKEAHRAAVLAKMQDSLC